MIAVFGIISIILNAFLIVFFLIERETSKLNERLYNNELEMSRSLFKLVNEKMVELAKKDEMIKELEEKSQSIAKQFREYVDMIHGEF